MIRRLIVLLSCFVLLMLFLRGYAVKKEEGQLFTVSRTATTEDVREKIQEQEFMRGRWFFGISLLPHGGYGAIDPGGYRVSPSMGSWTLASVLTSDPPLKWAVIPEGFRKEQVADRLTTSLGWDRAKRDQFLEAAVATPYDLTDGFYYPDTYLIPTDEDVEKVTKRFISRFNEHFDPLVPEFRDANIKFDTAVKLASILQREAAGKEDMPLIAGILWNRLLQKMPLEVDATLQYARGNTGSGYWAPISVADKQIDSPFNTYKHAGLPPAPISNPGLDAINAVIHSQETPCIFYLHAPDRQIHCAETYEGHLENIERYLRN